MRGDGFDRLEDFGERVKNRIGFWFGGFDLRLNKKMDVVRHDARGVEMDLPELAGVEDGVEDDAALGVAEDVAVSGGEGNHVFAPRALEVGEVAAGVGGFGGLG